MAHTSHGHAPQPDVNLLAKLGYEPRDIALNTLVKWLVALFIFIGVMTVFAYLLYMWFVPTYGEVQFISPMEYQRQLPANPQIQPRPKRDIMDYWATEDKVVKNYTPGENGTVNLPIGQAIDLLAQRGISGVTESAQPAVPDTRAYPGSGNYVSQPQNAEPAENGQGGTYSPTGSEWGVNGYFEGSATPNPFIGQSIPSPEDEAPAPGATQPGTGYSSQGTGIDATQAVGGAPAADGAG